MSLDVEAVLDHASSQGAGTPENAILQAALRSAFAQIEPAAAEALLASDTVVMTLEDSFCEKSASDVEDLISAARSHGEESDPDHEAGDLQAYLRAAFQVLDDSQREAVAIAAGMVLQAPAP